MEIEEDKLIDLKLLILKQFEEVIYKWQPNGTGNALVEAMMSLPEKIAISIIKVGWIRKEEKC